MYDAVCNDIANETEIENKLILAILALAEKPLATSELLELFRNSDISFARVLNALSDLHQKGLLIEPDENQTKLKIRD